MVFVTNLVPTGGWSYAGVTYTDGVFAFAPNVTAMSQVSMPTPTPGHKYYGRAMQKAPAGFTFADHRFEWYTGDTPTGLMCFARMVATDDQWLMDSDILMQSAPDEGNWSIRNFIVNGSAVCYRKELLIVDLTESFGSGNEPDKEWCDANIPYFVGTTYIYGPPIAYDPPDYIARTQAYMATLREPFQKLCRLRFLQPDGSTAFSLDNNTKNRRSGAFIADGSIATNLQNGKRRTATVMLSNLDGSFDYNVNTVWFGTEIAIDEGLILPDGEEYYIQQGVFLIENPTESIRPGNRVATYNLVDKWANLDGTLFGNLESTYEVPSGTNIFQPINAILALDKGNGQPVDRVTPVYTEYYNSKSQALPDGSTAAITNAPYTLRVDSDNGTYADVILGLAGMVNAWIGYDQTGALRIDPSQDDILDTNKPVLWQFSMDRVTFLGADYTVKNTEVYNDYIVIGELLDDNSQPAGRATNLDPRSDTNVQTIGRKTFRMSAPGFATDQQCQDLAVWKLKRSSALQKAITISCSQIFHIEENSLVSIVRTDKPGSPVERHLVMGFTRPLVATGEMQINAVSVQDFVTATVTSWPE